MSFFTWLRNWNRSAPSARGAAGKQRIVPRLEVLEDRTVPSGFQQINLVGVEPGRAHFTDPNLNGWGMASLPVDVGSIPKGSFCVANAFTTGLATFYDRSGHVLPQTITVPSSSVSTLFGDPGSAGHPTGVTYNDSATDFMISAHGVTKPATLIFDTIDGTISGWNPEVDPTHAIVIKDTWAAGTPAIFTGLDIGQDAHGNNVLYAADLFNDGVQRFDGSFNTVGAPLTDPSVPSLFTDPNGMNAWSVEAMNGKLFVTYANPLSNGPYGGVVDVFDIDGNLLTPNHFAANAPGAGPLQNPWGMTQAPANFGAYSNDLLIGNVAGKGNINVFDPNTGAYLGQLKQPNGAAVEIKGLWDLDFGEGVPDSGKSNQLFFDAGPNKPGDATGGLFGVILAAGDQGGNGGGHTAPALSAPTDSAIGTTLSLPPVNSSVQDTQIAPPSLPANAAFSQAKDQKSDALVLSATGSAPTQDENWLFATLSTIMKTKHDTVKNSISNIK